MAQLVKCLPGKCEDLSLIPRTTTTTTTIQKRNYGQEVSFSVNSAQQLEHLEGESWEYDKGPDLLL